MKKNTNNSLDFYDFKLAELIEPTFEKDFFSFNNYDDFLSKKHEDIISQTNFKNSPLAKQLFENIHNRFQLDRSSYKTFDDLLIQKNSCEFYLNLTNFIWLSQNIYNKSYKDLELLKFNIDKSSNNFYKQSIISLKKNDLKDAKNYLKKSLEENSLNFESYMALAFIDLIFEDNSEIAYKNLLLAYKILTTDLVDLYENFELHKINFTIEFIIINLIIIAFKRGDLINAEHFIEIISERDIEKNTRIFSCFKSLLLAKKNDPQINQNLTGILKSNPLDFYSTLNLINNKKNTDDLVIGLEKYIKGILINFEKEISDLRLKFDLTSIESPLDKNLNNLLDIMEIISTKSIKEYDFFDDELTHLNKESFLLVNDIYLCAIDLCEEKHKIKVNLISEHSIVSKLLALDDNYTEKDEFKTITSALLIGKQKQLISDAFEVLNNKSNQSFKAIDLFIHATNLLLDTFSNKVSEFHDLKSKFHLLKTLFKEFIREVSLIDNPSNFNFKNYNLYKLAIDENEHSKDEILNEIKVLTDEINADVSSLVTNTIQVAKQLQESGDFKGAQKLLETSINSIKNITS